ncbi:hypothetical protein QA640_21765 [Bradyrhizobium sp. CB82]|uniref:hypothetical protein n=1 Tax=Bradyrhizobium sp. CB82 TaxID=3039159 RepID=UPI0024B0674A|nr:hypothetical protein [Bradyrhizobium sp. CB82]WFU44851.1 hypothetical protein QA640_21765 [Bradyrhizobium sp. CB82]
MLATLNSKQIVDEIVKDTIKDNDPHDVLDIAPEIVLASRPDKPAPALVPDSATRPEPKINLVTQAPAAAPSVDTAVRAAASDLHVARKRSSVGKWLSGAFVTLLFAAGSAAATVAWQTHGDTAKAMVAAWMPTLVGSPSQATPPATEQASSSTEQQAAAADQPAEQPATPAQAQDNGDTSSQTTAPDAAQSLQSMTRDLAAMTQQIEQLKANIAELKASQEQMAREIAKAAPAKQAEARIADPRARLSALPPRSPAPPVRKPRPVAATPAYAPTYAPVPIAPPPQAAAVPPPPPPASTSQIADDDGPVVRPPMPVH